MQTYAVKNTAARRILMFILYGTKPFKRVIGRQHIDTICPNCQRPANWEVTRVISFFTLYFIPLVPYSIRYYLACPHCEASKKIDKAAAMELLSGSKNNDSMTGWQQNNCDLQDTEKDLSQSDLYESYTYRLPVEQMIRSEKKSLLRNYAIFIICAVLMFLMFRNGSYLLIPLLLFASAMFMLLIVLPAHTIKLLVINRNRVPESIHINYNSLRLGSRSISIRTIKVNSNSVFPIQRYLVIHTDTKKERFWFGSPVSFPDHEYAKICSSLERVFHNRNIPFKYSMKQSVWTK